MSMPNLELRNAWLSFGLALAPSLIKACRTPSILLILFDPQTGAIIATHAAEVDEAGNILRSTLMQTTEREGTPAYEQHLRQAGYQFTVVRDGGQGYRQHTQALANPAVTPAGHKPDR